MKIHIPLILDINFSDDETSDPAGGDPLEHRMLAASREAIRDALKRGEEQGFNHDMDTITAIVVQEVGEAKRISEPPVEPKKRTIRMTHRPPLRIVESQWPTIAVATYDDSDKFNGHGFIRVRQHKDGRHIVYGQVESSMSRDGSGSSTTSSAGFLLGPGENVPSMIRRVSTEIGESENLASYCINDLPPEEI